VPYGVQRGREAPVSGCEYGPGLDEVGDRPDPGVVAALQRVGDADRRYRLFEAKVYSGEEPEQCDRLARAWGPEVPTLVFLTRNGRLPLTAIQSAGQWQLLTWAQVGAVIGAAIDKVPDCAPGAHELLTTIETFGK
jgi:hypothetical protein